MGTLLYMRPNSGAGHRFVAAAGEYGERDEQRPFDAGGAADHGETVDVATRDEIGDCVRLKLSDFGEPVEEVRLLGFAVKRDQQARVQFAAVFLRLDERHRVLGFGGHVAGVLAHALARFGQRASRVAGSTLALRAMIWSRSVVSTTKYIH